MKLFLVIVLLVGSTFSLHAETEAEWRKKALAEFPEIGVKDSYLNRAFVATYLIVRRDASDIFSRPELSYTIATIIKRYQELYQDSPLSVDKLAEISAPKVIDFERQMQKKLGAAQPLGGCLDVNWGTSRAKAREIVTNHWGSNYEEKNSTEKMIFFNGGNFGTHPADVIALQFVDDQFYGAALTLKARGEAESYWRQLVEELKGKYGDPTALFPEAFLARWEFPNKDQATEELMCKGEASDVAMIYQNKMLAQRAK